METWIQWAIGLTVTLLTTLVGFMAHAHSKLSSKQSADVASLHVKLEEVKRDYVRRDDFSEFKKDVKDRLESIEDKQDELLKIVRSH